MLNIPTPISEQLRVANILTALILFLFLKSVHSNTPFEMAIANAVITKNIWSINSSIGWLRKKGCKGCYCCAIFVWFMFSKNFTIT